VWFILASELEGKTEDEIEMLKAMGFASFDTTKVISFSMNKIYFMGIFRVNIQKVQPMLMDLVFNKNVVIGKKFFIIEMIICYVFRQYMNRKGGFNRPLDPIA
jgi:U4/U6.U5 tri-snRNP-associated protein 3